MSDKSSFRRFKLWIPALCFAALFAVLFLYRTGFFRESAPRSDMPRFAAPENFPDKSSWMNIYQDRQKIGFSHATYAKLEDGYRFGETVFMKINTMGLIQDLHLKTDGRLHADFSLAEFALEVSSGRFSFSAHGSIDGHRLDLVVDSAGSEQKLQLELAEKIYFTSGIVQAAAAGGLKPGDRLTFNVFDPVSMGREPIHLEVIGQEEIRIMGQPRKATRVSLTYKGANQQAWVDETGDVLKEQGMLGITREKTTAEIAMIGLSGQPVMDLTQIASIASNVELADAESLNILMAEIDGIEEKASYLNGGRQTYRAPVLTVEKERIEENRLPVHGEAESEETAPYLKPEPFIQSDHPAIRRLAREIAADAGDGLAKARRIVAWIQEHIKKRPVLSLPDALATLENRAGDCNEHAVLFAALARACGIPTKVEVGVVYLKKRFYYHAWNAVYLEKWITLDALFDQIPADVTHIRLVGGAQKEQLNILSMIGNLKIRILDGTR